MQEPTLKKKLLWKNIFFFIYFHIGAVYGINLLFTSAKWKTFFWLIVLILMSTHGVTVGAHRLWAHRSFKAKLPLRVLLAFYQTLTFQLSIYDWVRDHRVHHKYSDTEFDPHNARRGFFYSHMGWLFLTKSQKVIKKGKELDLSDLEADPVVVFQRKYYWYLAPITALVFPVIVPCYYWNESFWTSWYICNALRYFLTIHASCSVNSVAHIWGYKPYDKNIVPTENAFVAHITSGEGFHNYHHVFPWDYKAGEFGNYSGNLNAKFIELMAKIGLAYDLKYASKDMIQKRARKTGDGSKNDYDQNVWGWEECL